MNIDPELFPKLPSHRFQGAPVFLSPIMGSEESICVAIIVQIESDEFHVTQTIRPDMAKCMMGSNAGKLLGLIKILTESLSKHAKNKLPLTDWAAPISSAKLGPVINGYADSEIMAFRTIARKHSFLSTPHDFERAIDQTNT